MTQTINPLIIAPRAPSKLARRIRSLADMRGLWSLSDQAVLSAGNFFTGWLLLRSDVPWYGNYFTVLNIIYFLNNLHAALVTYPISVTSAGISDSELRRRVRRALGMTLILIAAESAIVCFGTVATVGWGLLPWVIGALAFWQLQETVRRALMARLEHRRAIFGDAISYLGQAAAIFVVLRFGTMSIETAFAIIGITSAVAMGVQALQLRLQQPSTVAAEQTFARQAKNHLWLGQWILLSSALNLLTVYSIPWVIRYFHGQHGVAEYSAVLFVLNACNPLLTSVANLITPVVAKVKAEAHAGGKTGAHETRNAALKYALQGAAVLFPCFLFLLIFPSLALHIFYKAHSPYLLLTTPLRVFTVCFMLLYVSAMMASYLCGLGKSHLQLVGTAANAVVTCLITLPLVAKFGVIGAAWGGLFPITAQVAISIYLVLNVNRWLTPTSTVAA